MLAIENFWAGFLLLIIYLPIILMWGFTLWDLFHRRYMAWWKLVLWLFFIIFFPIIGSIVYWIARPVRYDLPVTHHY
jgi:hypothetical protein